MVARRRIHIQGAAWSVREGGGAFRATGVMSREEGVREGAA
jgi:hypothetical protein